jgi:hypothetical protein
MATKLACVSTAPFLLQREKALDRYLKDMCTGVIVSHWLFAILCQHRGHVLQPAEEAEVLLQDVLEAHRDLSIISEGEDEGSDALAQEGRGELRGGRGAAQAAQCADDIDRQDLGTVPEMGHTVGNITEEDEAKRRQLARLIFGQEDAPKSHSEEVARSMNKVSHEYSGWEAVVF